MFDAPDIEKHSSEAKYTDSVTKYVLIYICILLLAGLQFLIARQNISTTGMVRRMLLIAQFRRCHMQGTYSDLLDLFFATTSTAKMEEAALVVPSLPGYLLDFWRGRKSARGVVGEAVLKMSTTTYETKPGYGGYKQPLVILRQNRGFDMHRRNSVPRNYQDLLLLWCTR